MMLLLLLLLLMMVVMFCRNSRSAVNSICRTSLITYTRSCSRKFRVKLEWMLKFCLGVMIGLTIPFTIINLERCIKRDEPAPSGVATVWVYDDIEPDRNLVFIGAMSAKKYIDSRAVAAYRTYAKHIPGKIVFFTSEGSTSSFEVPFVALPGVNDSYPPQKKSFMMLKYMHDFYLDKFEFFMRVDDDVYIKPQKLEKFLRSINSSILQFIGQSGKGRKAELGKLSLDDDENFCMGGPGMVMTRATLQAVVPNISHCLKNLLTYHEDVEVGRCIRQFAGIPCTWAHEMRDLFYHNYSGDDVDDLKGPEVIQAITLHPIKHVDHFYRVHYFILQERSLDWNHDCIVKKRTIQTMDAFIAGKDNFIPSYDVQWRPQHPDEIIISDLFHQRMFSPHYTTPKQALKDYWKRALQMNAMILAKWLKKSQINRHPEMLFDHIDYAYLRMDPVIGVEYSIGSNFEMTASVGKRIHVHQPFMSTRMVEVDTVPEERNSAAETSIDVHVIMPLAGRLSTLQRFLNMYESVCLQTKDNVHLTLVQYPSASDTTTELAAIHEQFDRLKASFKTHKIHVISKDGAFRRGEALHVGLQQLDASDLACLIDVDMIFDKEFFQRVRLVTQPGRQVYFPIVYSQFDPAHVPMNESTFDSHSSTGYWRYYGFGMACFFVQDYRNTGRFDLSITGWGKEDVDLFEKFIATNISIVRAVDPGLVHMFHPNVACEGVLFEAQLKMCLGSMSQTYGSSVALAKHVFDHDILNRLP